MKKRLLLALLSVLLSFSAKSEIINGICGDNLTWTLDTETGIFTVSGTGEMYDYSRYGSLGYQYNGYLKHLVIENGATYIGKYAFYGCESLVSVTLPNTLANIGYAAFRNCTSLPSVTLPDSLVSIDELAFYYCASLVGITFPSSIVSIGVRAFCDCSSIENVFIPRSVANIGEGAFSRCPKIESMSVESGNAVYDSRNNCNAIVETATNTIIAGCNNSEIPLTATSIGVCAFQGCQLKSLDLHNNIVEIGKLAFSRCGLLSSISIPKSVESIGEGAFGYCNNVKSIVVSPLNGTYDSRNNCNAIIETQTNRLINGCNSSTIPNTVVSIENYAFWGCMSITSITIPNSVVTIGDNTFSDCTSLVSMKIPNSVITIGDSAFSSCTSMISVEIPNSIVTIGEDVFYGCSSLVSMKIPNSVAAIGYFAFGFCSNLVSLTISNSVTKIGDGAFFGCSSLASVYCLATIPPLCEGNNVFNNEVQETSTLFVPFGCLQKYKDADVWKDFIHVAELPQGYGVEECLEIEFSIFPNPTTDIVNVKCKDMTKVTVFGMRGETIVDVNTNADSYVITDLNVGTYFVRIETAKGGMTQKIVKL